MLSQRGGFFNVNNGKNVLIQHFPPDELPIFFLRVCTALELCFYRTVLSTAHSPPGVIRVPEEKQNSENEREAKLFAAQKAEVWRSQDDVRSSGWESAADNRQPKERSRFLAKILMVERGKESLSARLHFSLPSPALRQWFSQEESEIGWSMGFTDVGSSLQPKAYCPLLWWTSCRKIQEGMLRVCCPFQLFQLTVWLRRQRATTYC